ncbi:MAG: SDR family oxidoreductase [Clostridia bacterium]|nr:SDR family oxidoreductase [Clostridia bacterium]
MKQVFITGGVRGIGLATARLFAEKGYAVTVCYSSDEEGAKKARDEGFRVIKADVSKEEDVRRIFEEIGNVDVLVNNAGVSLVKQIQDTTLEEWNRVFSVNVTGAFLCSSYALKGMLKKGGGCIINVSSVWGVVGGSCEVAYSSSKAALIGFTKALSKEVGYSGVRVNCVAPGAIDTKMNGCFSKEELSSLAEEIPAGRLGKAEEVAKAVYALCENEYIHGQILGVDGGFGL